MNLTVRPTSMELIVQPLGNELIVRLAFRVVAVIARR